MFNLYQYVVVGYRNSSSLIWQTSCLEASWCIHFVVGFPIKAYYITADDMHKAMKLFPDLVDRLWRVCGVRIAVPLLLDMPNYYNWTKDKIRIMCERSFIATLPKGPNAVFKANEQMKEVYNL